MKYAPPIGQEAQGEAAHYIDGNPELGILGSPVPAAALEPVQRELVHVIRQAGLDPSGEDLTQLFHAICKVIGIKAPLATLLRAGLMQPDGKTVSVDEDGLLSALGGNLLLNSEQWITESGTFTAPVGGWYEVLLFAGGNAAYGLTGHFVSGGNGGCIKEALIYLQAGQQVPVIIGAGAVASLTLGYPSPVGSNIGGTTSFGEIQVSIDADYSFFAAQEDEEPNGMVRAAGSGLGGGATPNPKTYASQAERNAACSARGHWGGGGGSRIETTGEYGLGDGAQGSILARWHDPAKAAGPLPEPALLKARRMAARATVAPATVNLYDPETGQGSVWREEDAPAQLAKGLITEEAWQEIRAAKAAEDYAAWLSSPDTEAERFELLRMACEARLTATDKLTTSDYPISDEDRAVVNAYRKTIRELNHQPGAPWDGGGEATPWPVEPVVTKVQEA